MKSLQTRLAEFLHWSSRVDEQPTSPYMPDTDNEGTDMTKATSYVIKREQVTPAIAREWLKKNASNRSVRRRHVEALARAMKAGRWKFNYETIIFSDTGRLLNGQHRLEAVILSGVSIEIGVVRNAPEDIYTTLDQGTRRRASDDLQAAGHVNTQRLAATARIVIMWDEALPTKSSGIDKTEIVDFVTQHPDLADFVSMVNGRKGGGAGDLIPVSALAAVGWMATHTPEYKAKFDEFLEKLNSGAELESDSPVLVLRNYGINVRRGHTLQGVTWFGLVATAWNDFVNNRPRKIFRPENQNWPAEVAGYAVKRDPKSVKSTFTYIGPKAQQVEGQLTEANT